MKQTNRWFPLWGLFFSISLVAQAGWIVESEVVDDSADVGVYNSIAVDEAGRAHIAYYDADNQNLKSAMQDESGSWSNQVVESSGDVGSYCSIAVDSNGVPQISYHYFYQQTIGTPPFSYTVDRGDLKVAEKVGSTWSLTTVDNAAGQMGRYTSLAIDSSGRPRVAYHDAAQNNLRYVENNGSWGTPQTVESGGKGASLVLDSNGYPHISHVDGTELRYVYWNGSSWVSEMVEDYQVEGERTSIALDSNGYPHIVYVNVEGLHYIFWDGTQWNDELVHWVNNGAVGVSSPSLVLNSDDEAFISFHGNLWGDLAVVVAVRNGVNDWSMPAWLLEGTTPGGQTSITVGTNDILHVSFYDQTTGELGYAKVMEDSDGDWLPDWWEMKYFQDLDEGATGDPDGDNWDNAYEYEIGTDPTVDDRAANSWDRDGDGLGNDDEVNIYGTNPDDPDSDDDGILDGVETGYHLFWDSFEDATIDDRWSPGGGQVWTIDSSVAQDGSQSARSGAISDGQSSTLELDAVLLGAGTASFWYRTSCETNSDALYFATNGISYASYSGSNDWTLTYLEGIPAGTNTFRWTYEKDASGSGGDDAAWIDSVYVGVTAIGTSPTNSDSDADGLLDGAEVYTYGTNPTNSDSDADGLLDGEEISAGSDPYDTDSDEDGLNDGDEVHLYGTDPTLADSDSDLMPDGWEVAHSLNPTNSADAAADIEPDGLTNRGEYQAGTDPRVADVDGDGLNDGPEILTWGSDPFEPDSDGDGLSDGVEALHYGSSPTNTDSDADGLPDGVETNGVGVLAFSFEDGVLPSGWSTSGDASWYVDASNGSHRVRAARSGAISDNESSSLQYPVTTADGDVSYRYRISSWWPDRLVASGGVEASGGHPGDSGWFTNTFSVTAGARTLSWSYVKDIDHAGGEDCAWIDYVTVPVPGSGTDRLNPDSDGDGLKDGVETRTGVYVSAQDTGTDPTDDDSDNDGLKDGVETVTGVYSNTVDTGTDPTKADTDGDGLKDGWETMTGTYISSTDTGTDPTKLDSDGDGIYDGYETATGTYVSPTNTGTDPTKLDSDGDGIRDDYETGTGIYVNPTDTGTDPTKADTDSDDLPDNVETDTGTWVSSANTGTDPNVDDTDGDGVVDGAETHTGVYLSSSDRGTDPHDTDSDGDNLLDGVESGSGTFVGSADTGTDPNKTDTDGDGFRDDYETGTGIYVDPTHTGTDPTQRDSDGDGLNDEVETLTGIYVSASDTGTDPNNPDTDGDGAPDGAETDTGIWVNSLDRGTDPHNPDTDGDSLWDGAETHTGIYSNSLDAGSSPLDPDSDGDTLSDGDEVYVHHTDPNKADTDADGLADGAEIDEYNTDPLNPDTDDDGLNDGDEIHRFFSFIESFEANALPAGWTTGGDVGWLEETNDVHDGDSSMVSGTLGKNQNSWIELSIRTWTNDLTFWRRTYGSDGEHLALSIDGDTKSTTYDYSDWGEITNALTAGDHVLRWTFHRSSGNGNSFGGDRGLIDLIELTRWDGTDPLDSDSDDDGISDGDEVHVHFTEPNIADTDRDGMPDGYEVDHQLNPLVDDSAGDADSDGLNNGDEHSHGSDPQVKDSDGDGVEDGTEVHTYGSDPMNTDSDADGLEDGDEVTLGTGLMDADSDDDRVQDGAEVHTYGTEPLVADTDADGLSDGDEIVSMVYFNSFEAAWFGRQWSTTGDVPWEVKTTVSHDGVRLAHSTFLQPQKTNTLSVTMNVLDGEIAFWWSAGMALGAEVEFTIDGQWQAAMGGNFGWTRMAYPVSAGIHTFSWNVRNYADPETGWAAIDSVTMPIVASGTLPLDDDSDDDGLKDGEEVNLYGSDPLDTDTDDDGLTDFAETQTHFTDPNRPDSDRDGMPDGWEVQYGLQPRLQDGSGDLDSDQLSNLLEYQYGTNPTVKDSDGDGLEDGPEVVPYGSDPMDTDSDDDGLNDGDEVHLYGSSPILVDSDGDGVSDYDEVMIYGTDPANGDTDDDGFGDALERGSGSDAADEFSYPAWAWTHELVDATPGVGWESAVAVDSLFNPWVVYQDTVNTNVKLAVRSGTNWTVQVLDADAASYPAIAIDSSNRVHVSYRHEEAGTTSMLYSLKYALYDGNQWTIQTVSTNGAYWSDIALDTNGFPHIAFIDIAHSNVVHAYWNGSDWTEQIVDSTEDDYPPPGVPCIETDTSGQIHFLYTTRDSFPRHLSYAMWNGSTWVRSTVSGPVNPGDYSLAVDTNGYPHVAWYEWDDETLRYAFWNGTSWTDEVIDTEGRVGRSPSIAIDTAGRPCVVYRAWYGHIDHQNIALKYAFRQNGRWYERVAAEEPEITLNEQGNCNGCLGGNGAWYVSYNDSQNKNLRYAEGWLDSDDDGLSSHDELAVFSTDPNIADTDNDGLGDGEEVLRYGTQPTLRDTDQDWLSDGEETALEAIHEETFAGGMPTGWTTGGATHWGVLSGGYDDGFRIVSDLGDNEYSTSTLEWQTNTPAGTISFYCGTDCQGGWEGLSFFIDGVKQDAWSGRIAWKKVVFDIEAGAHTFRWENYEDSERLANPLNNQVWIDDVVVSKFVIGTDPATFDTDQDGLGDGEEYLPELPGGSESFEPEPVAAPLAMRAMADAPVGGGGGLPSGWSTSGDAPWSLVSGEAYDGSGSIRSGIIADSQVSTLEFTTNLNAGRISFWAKCSSENESDTLEFLVDGATSNIWSGEIAWTNVSASFTAGLHTFRWVYAKDGSGSDGSDAAWLDLVEFFENGIGTDPLDSDTDGDAMADGWEVNAGLDPKASADGTADADGDGALNKNEYIADTDPNDSNDWFRITSFDVTSDQKLYFNSSAERLYSLLVCTNLTDGVWTNSPDVPVRAGAGGADLIQVTNRLPNVFYKLTVELP